METITQDTKEFEGRPIHSKKYIPSHGKESEDPRATWGAFREAEDLLRSQGYSIGSMCGPEPIGFAPADQYKYIAKWYNLGREDIKLLHGVIVADGGFRDGGMWILYFIPPVPVI